MSYSKEEKWLLDEKYKGQESKAFYADIERLKAGEPLDYLIGFTDFLECRIYLDGCPLIPRTETEYWVEQTFPELSQSSVKKSLRILDIFSGSGCIGISLLKHIPNCSVTFAEKEKGVLTTIEKNIDKNSLNGLPYRIVESDVFSAITEKFDYIYANPPYIDERRDAVEESVVAFEPHEALFAPESGLYYIKKLIVEAPKHLEKGGVLFIECDPWQKEDIVTFLDSLQNKYQSVEFREDQYGRTRLLRLTSGWTTGV